MKQTAATLLAAAALVLGVQADEAAKAALMQSGQTAFATCMACHGADGQGLPVGPQKMAPSLTDSKVALGKPEVLALVILNGIQKEGMEYVGMMAPLGAALTDEQLAGVMTYVRNSFNNSASVVTVEDAKKYREMWKDQKTPVTRAKIEELLAK